MGLFICKDWGKQVRHVNHVLEIISVRLTCMDFTYACLTFLIVFFSPFLKDDTC